MKVTTQYLAAAKKNTDGSVQILLAPENETEKSLLGAAYIIGNPSIELEDDGSLSLTLAGN
jgi:hypothetical protein